MHTLDKKINEESTDKRLIPHCCSVLDALKAINSMSGDVMTLFVVDDMNRPLGSVTDGDIRRALISGVALSDYITAAMHREFLMAREGDDLTEKIAISRRRGIRLLPVVDASGRIIRMIDLRVVHAHIPIDAVLMAGGRGERLRPLTLDCPKPLLEVGGRAIIDYNVANLASCGVENIYVTVNYLHQQIERHFAEPVAGVDVKCVLEPQRLGTFGSLALVPESRNPDTLVMNSDLLTSIDFEQMYLHHKMQDADFTIAAVSYPVSVPFAILRHDNERVTGLEEKPTYNYLANGGVYLMKSSLRQRIKEGVFLDAPDFILSLIREGLKVVSYPITGTWIDIGSPDDYRYACELMSRPAGMSL